MLYYLPAINLKSMIRQLIDYITNKSRLSYLSWTVENDDFIIFLSKPLDKLLFKRDGGIDLVLVGDEAIKMMNKEYRGINKTTDVLSFAYLEVTEYEKEKGDIIVGDIFVSVDGRVFVYADATSDYFLPQIVLHTNLDACF